MESILHAYKRHQKLGWLLFLLIGVLAAYFAKGLHQLDEHYQVIEWSRWIMGESFSQTWEATQKLRHPLLAYWMAGYLKLGMGLGIQNPESLMLWARLLSFIFNGSVQLYCLYQFGKRLFPQTDQRLWFPFLLISSPFIYYFLVRTSSETYGMTFLLLSLTLMLNLTRLPTYLSQILAGFCTVVAFAMRFAVAAAFMGQLVILFGQLRKRQWGVFFAYGIGILLGLMFFMFIEYQFYGEYFASPIQYYQFNVGSGESASTFGVEPGFNFLIFFLVIFFPLNILWLFKLIFQPHQLQCENNLAFPAIFLPLIVACISFTLVHLKIGHKEFRFLLPILPLLFILIVFPLIQRPLITRKIWAAMIFLQIPIFLYLSSNYPIQLPVTRVGCNPMVWHRDKPPTMIWTEGVYRFYHFPAFYCGIPIEVLPLARRFPVELFTTQSQLRTYLKNLLPFAPKKNDLIQPRFVRQDSWFYSDEERATQLKTLPLLLSFSRNQPPKSIPEGCSLKRAPQPFDFLVKPLPAPIQNWFLSNHFYLYCDKPFS